MPLSALTCALNLRGYQFATIAETVLQPINGYYFKTRLANLKPLVAKKTVVMPGEFSIQTNLARDSMLLDTQVLDVHGQAWMHLGSVQVMRARLAWASTTIPVQLVNHHLCLVVRVSAGTNSPALDELFVIASSNAI